MQKVDMQKLGILRELSFGQRVAEDEVDNLERYFVETDQWNQLFRGAADIVYGYKGSGKSALYTLLRRKEGELLDRGVLIALGEEPRGETAFESISVDPPSTERQFIDFWKLYILVLVARQLEEYGASSDAAKQLFRLLEQAGFLGSEPAGLSSVLRKARDYVRRAMEAVSVEPSLKAGDVTVSTRISLSSEAGERVDRSRVPLAHLFDLANAALMHLDVAVWVLMDRLDVAFQDNPYLEAAALKALFHVYLDIRSWERISLKIFLRTDIWDRITRGGFREASHITKHVTIEWGMPSLLNLVVRRLMDNATIRRYTNLAQSEALASTEKQSSVFYRLFPPTSGVGHDKRASFDWIVTYLADGNHEVAPRDVIHLLEEARRIQVNNLELGKSPPLRQFLFDGVSLPSALGSVSTVRLKQTLFAEHPGLKPYIDALAGGGAVLSLRDLAEAWEVKSDEARPIIGKLEEVGFLRRQVPTKTSWFTRPQHLPRADVPPRYRRHVVALNGSIKPTEDVSIDSLGRLWKLNRAEASEVASCLVANGLLVDRVAPKVSKYSVALLYRAGAKVVSSGSL